MRFTILVSALLLGLVAVATAQAVGVAVTSNDGGAGTGATVPEVDGPSLEIELHPLSPMSQPGVPRDCGFSSSPNGLSLIPNICGPSTGTGAAQSKTAGAVGVYTGLAVAMLAVALFAGGLALRVVGAREET